MAPFKGPSLNPSCQRASDLTIRAVIKEKGSGPRRPSSCYPSVDNWRPSLTGETHHGIDQGNAYSAVELMTRLQERDHLKRLTTVSVANHEI